MDRGDKCVIGKNNLCDRAVAVESIFESGGYGVLVIYTPTGKVNNAVLYAAS